MTHLFLLYRSRRPYITVDGGDPVLHLDLNNLEMEVTLMAEQQGNNPDYIETTVEFPVQKMAYDTGYNRPDYQCSIISDS